MTKSKSKKPSRLGALKTFLLRSAKQKPKPAKVVGKAKPRREAQPKKQPKSKLAISKAKPSSPPQKPAAAVRSETSAPKPAARRAVVRESESNEQICREVACEGLATTFGYCRLHYIKNWKKIKRKQLILKEKKLNRYIEELVAKYPDKYIEAIRQDLANDKDFSKVVSDLELGEEVDEFEIETESVDNLIDSIRRDVDDEGDPY